MPDTNISRRVVATGGGALLTLPGMASTAAAAAPSPDAELARLSELILAGYAEMEAILARQAKNDDCPSPEEARLQQLVDDGGQQSATLANLPAVTLAGCRAKAAALLTYIEYAPDGLPSCSGYDQLLGWSIARDLLNGAL